MKVCLALLLVATAAEARPRCPSPRVHAYRSLAAANDALGWVPRMPVAELEGRGNAFFVDVSIGSPEGSDAVDYKVAAIFIRADKTVVVVDDLARWVSVIPEPGHPPFRTPAQAIRVDGKLAHLELDGAREALVDVAGAKYLGCAK